MFNEKATQTYTFQDASQEIIIMLLGAFLLGCLLTWLLHKLFNKDYSVENGTYRYQNQVNDEIVALKQANTPQNNTTSDVKIVDKPSQTRPKIVTSPDDLTKISGIDSNIQKELKEFNIESFADLRDIDSKDLKAIQNKQLIHKREIETWPHQASLASRGQWTKLKDYQGFIHRVQAASGASADTKLNNNQSVKDDLTKVVGISPEIEKVLNVKGINTFGQLSKVDSDVLKDHIVKNDPKLANQETESWAHQAAMAEKEQWEELKVYQDFMKSDSGSNTENNANASEKSIKENDNIDEQNLGDHDDLKKIEGIGPKIEEVLNKGGIYTYSQLYNSNRDRLKKLLTDAGSQFRMHEPESWPHQAGMANRGEWDELETYQHSLINEQASKAETKKVTKKSQKIKKTTKLKAVSNKDDLRKIEGIGPKIQEILNSAGIETFKSLSKESRDSIKKILSEAGPQFRMHEPESWPQQAKLAAKGDLKELKKYQDKLNGGRK